jgi:hypothetical protein
MTNRIRTIAVALAFAMAGIATGCSGIPQDDRYQTHGNPSWTGFRA